MDAACTENGCALAVLARGWCSKHYYRWYRHGDPTFTVDRRTGRTHGIRATYQNGCRCRGCRKAERTYRAEYRKRLKSATVAD